MWEQRQGSARVRDVDGIGARRRRKILSRFASVRLEVGRACELQRLVHPQDTAWGTPGQLVGGTVWVQVAGIFSAEDGVCRALNEQIQNQHA